MKIGDYEIEAEIGEGGMAKVYRAKHSFLETMHAIKVLDPSYRVQPEARKRFLDEAKIQAKHLDHDNIVKVTNIVATDDHAALVMELVDGPSLESMLPELKSRPAHITRIMIGILDAVGHAHDAGIIHRDLKPANVLLAKQNGTLVPKVTDFGIAKVTDASKGGVKKSTHAAARMGTLSYMSPEQIRRAKDVTARSDIFSLGAMLYEMATGELAFPGDSEYDVMENIVNGRYTPPRQRYPQIDAIHAQVIEKAMATDPAQRYASCAEMAAALRGAAVVAVKPPAPPPRAPAKRTATPAKGTPAPAKSARAATPPPIPKAAQNKSKVALVAGLCLVGAAGLGGAAFYLSRGSDSTTPTTGSAAGSATSTGSAAVDPQKPVAAPGNTAAPIDADDPWAGTGSATWDVDPKAFPAGAETPPSTASSAGKTKYVMLADDTSTLATPSDGDRARIHYRTWRLRDRTLVDFSEGTPLDYTVKGGSLGRSEVLQQMTKGDVVRLWTEMNLVDSSGSSETSLVVTDMELVSFEPAAAPRICTGAFKSGEDLEITVNGATLGVCGSYTFITEGFKGQMRCRGDLTCSDGKAEFKCAYDKMQSMRIEGTMTFTCAGDALAADITTGGKVRSWILPRVRPLP